MHKMMKLFNSCHAQQVTKQNLVENIVKSIAGKIIRNFWSPNFKMSKYSKDQLSNLFDQEKVGLMPHKFADSRRWGQLDSQTRERWRWEADLQGEIVEQQRIQDQACVR